MFTVSSERQFVFFYFDCTVCPTSNVIKSTYRGFQKLFFFIPIFYTLESYANVKIHPSNCQVVDYFTHTIRYYLEEKKKLMLKDDWIIEKQKRSKSFVVTHLLKFSVCTDIPGCNVLHRISWLSGERRISFTYKKKSILRKQQ